MPYICIAQIGKHLMVGTDTSASVTPVLCHVAMQVVVSPPAVLHDVQGYSNLAIGRLTFELFGNFWFKTLVAIFGLHQHWNDKPWFLISLDPHRTFDRVGMFFPSSWYKQCGWSGNYAISWFNLRRKLNDCKSPWKQFWGYLRFKHGTKPLPQPSSMPLLLVFRCLQYLQKRRAPKGAGGLDL